MGFWHEFCVRTYFEIFEVYKKGIFITLNLLNYILGNTDFGVRIYFWILKYLKYYFTILYLLNCNLQGFYLRKYFREINDLRKPLLNEF